MTIKCENCGKHYDFNTDEICPNCGEYTRPNKKYSPQKEKDNQRFDYIETKKQLKRDFDKPSSRQTYGEYTQRKNKNENEHKKKARSIASIIPFIVVIVSMFSSVIGDVFDDFPFTSSDQFDTSTDVTEEYVEPIMTYEYFTDNVTTNIAQHTINSVKDVGQSYYEDEKIIAVNLSSELNDDVYSQFELNDIYIEYTIGDEGDTFQSYDIYYSSDSTPELYSELEHYNISSFTSEEHTEGALLFSIPKDIESFSLVIEEIEYDYSTNNPTVSEIYRYSSEFGY